MLSQKQRIPPPKPRIVTVSMGGHTVSMVAHPDFDEEKLDVIPPYRYIDTMEPVEVFVTKHFLDELSKLNFERDPLFVEDGIGYSLVYSKSYEDIFETKHVVALKRVEPIQPGDFIPLLTKLRLDTAYAASIVSKQIENVLWHGFIEYDTTSKGLPASGTE